MDKHTYLAYIYYSNIYTAKEFVKVTPRKLEFRYNPTRETCARLYITYQALLQWLHTILHSVSVWLQLNPAAMNHKFIFPVSWVIDNYLFSTWNNATSNKHDIFSPLSAWNSGIAHCFEAKAMIGS